MDWLGEDLVRTALLTGLVAALVVMVVQGRVPDEERRLAVWRAVVAAGWFAVVLGAGVATRLDPDLRLCKTTTVTGDAATSSETSRDAAGAVTGETRTAAGATKQTTETCEPLGVPEMAVLSLPSLVLIAPILKGINIAGLFGVDFREFQSRVAQQATDQVVRVIIEQKFGDQATAAVKQAASGEVTDLPQA